MHARLLDRAGSEVTASLVVRHNIEVAHRLSLLPGKCENIHGHSMWVTLEMRGHKIDQNGLLGGLDFGAIKKAFRAHLDTAYDHRLLLNEIDLLAGMELPGARLCPGDPTTENIAKWVAQWARQNFQGTPGFRVRVDETHVNAAVWETDLWSPS